MPRWNKLWEYGGREHQRTDGAKHEQYSRPLVEEPNPSGNEHQNPHGGGRSYLTSTQERYHFGIESGDNAGTYNDAQHIQFAGANFHAPVSISSRLQSDAAAGFLAAEALEYLVHNIDWNILLGKLSIVDQDQYRSEISPFDFNNPNFFWITRNIDFEQWKSADTPRALFLRAPPGHGRMEICSRTIELAKEEACETNGSVLYFFCSSAPQSRCSTILIHTLLYQIIYGSSDGNTNSIAAGFLDCLIGGHIKRKSDIRENDPLDETIRKILDAPQSELLEGLVEAIKKAGIQELSIIVDGLQEKDSIASRLFELLREAIPKLTYLLTSQHPLERTPNGITSIEYGKERKECLRFLRHDDTRYEKISNEHHGSLEWLWKHPQYLEWSASTTSSLLYIEGKPGSGKSTLARYFRENVVNREPNARSSIVAHYFYTFRGTQLEPTHVNMLRSILCSILEQDESTFFHFQREFRNSRRGDYSQWPYDSLKRVLSSFADHPAAKPLYLILDAMDESEEDDRRGIIQLLCNLCLQENPCNIKVFLASRPLAQLQHRIGDSHHVIRMQDMNKDDIARFADDFIERDLELTGNILRETRDYIVENAQGVFLWVALVKSELLGIAETGCRPSEILSLLKSLPQELEALYERIFSRLDDGPPRDVQDGIILFRFIFFALRPLTVEELRDALAVADDENRCFEDFQQGKIVAIERRIEHCGGGFLEIKDGAVQFMHQTVREFTIRAIPCAKNLKFEISDKEANRTIAITLVRYLMLCFTSPAVRDRFSQIKDWGADGFRTNGEHRNEWPLVDYALLFIKEYRDLCGQVEGIAELATAMVQKLTKNHAPYPVGSFVDFHPGGNNRQATKVNNYQESSQDIEYRTLNAVTEPPLPHAVRVLLTCTQEDGNAKRQTPLMISIQKRVPTVTRLLLDQNVVVDPMDKSGRTALHYVAADAGWWSQQQGAAENGHEVLARLLLDRGADASTADRNGWTPLHAAAENGHEALARLLEERGADVNAADKRGRTPLHAAAENGHEALAHLLVVRGADVTARDIDRRTPLHAAAENGHEVLARLLVVRGADVTAPDTGRRTPLHAAAKNGLKALARLLVARGAKVTAPDIGEWTPLHAAAENGHEAVASLLLARGASATAATHDGWTPLHIAAMNGHETVALVLMGRGADVMAVDRDGRTPLHVAANSGHEALVQLLTAATAPPSSQ